MTHQNRVLQVGGPPIITETVVAPFTPTVCLVLKRMRWQDRGFKQDYKPNTEITLECTPANDWADGHTFLPSRFNYGEHFVAIDDDDDENLSIELEDMDVTESDSFDPSLPKCPDCDGSGDDPNPQDIYGAAEMCLTCDGSGMKKETK